MISAHAGRRRLPGALRLVMLVALTAGLAMVRTIVAASSTVCTNWLPGAANGSTPNTALATMPVNSGNKELCDS